MHHCTKESVTCMFLVKVFDAVYAECQNQLKTSQDISWESLANVVSTVTRLEPGQLRIVVQFLTGARYLTVFQSTQTKSGANPVLYSVGTWSKAGGSMKLTPHLHL